MYNGILLENDIYAEQNAGHNLKYSNNYVLGFIEKIVTL